MFWRTLLSVSTHDPNIQTVASVDISTLPRVLRISSVIEMAFSVLCFGYGSIAPKPWLPIALGALLFCDAVRILGWKLEITPEYLRVRRYFLWRSIPWAQILKVGAGDTWGRGQKAVRLDLNLQPMTSLGAFPESFAVAVRDALLAEINRRDRTPT
jgi:hypothetical protein